MRIKLLWILLIFLILSCGEAGRNQKKKHFLHKGNIAFKEKLYHEAIRYYKSSLEVDPNFAQAYNNLGIVYQELEKYDEAKEAFDNCISFDPDFTDAYYNRSNTNYELNNFYESINDLKIIENSYSPEAIAFSKGLSFFGLKQYDSAVFYFSHALRLDSANIENYLNLATIRYYLNDYGEALSLVKKSMELDPNSTIAQNLQGLIYTENEEYEKALASFNNGISLKSNDAYLLNNRGYVYLVTGNPDLALKDINESILLDADNAWAYRNKGIYYYLTQDYDNAERLLLQSIQMDNSILLSYFYLGKIYLDRNQLEKACEAFMVLVDNGDKEGEKTYQQYCQ